MRVTDEMVRRLSDHLKQKVFYGTLNNEARDTKAREFLEVALSHAAGQEVVAPDEVYIREAAGTYTLCDLQETTFDDVPMYCARKASALTPAQPPASAEVGRAVVDLGEGGILHGASISGNVTIKAARIGQASACTFTGTTPAAEQGEGVK